MTRSQANDLLDRVRAGADVPRRLIDEALLATGDLPQLEPIEALIEPMREAA